MVEQRERERSGSVETDAPVEASKPLRKRFRPIQDHQIGFWAFWMLRRALGWKRVELPPTPLPEGATDLQRLDRALGRVVWVAPRWWGALKNAAAAPVRFWNWWWGPDWPDRPAKASRTPSLSPEEFAERQARADAAWAEIEEEASERPTEEEMARADRDLSDLAPPAACEPSDWRRDQFFRPDEERFEAVLRESTVRFDTKLQAQVLGYTMSELQRLCRKHTGRSLQKFRRTFLDGVPEKERSRLIEIWTKRLGTREGPPVPLTTTHVEWDHVDALRVLDERAERTRAREKQVVDLERRRGGSRARRAIHGELLAVSTKKDPAGGKTLHYYTVQTEQAGRAHVARYSGSQDTWWEVEGGHYKPVTSGALKRTLYDLADQYQKTPHRKRRRIREGGGGDVEPAQVLRARARGRR